MGIYVCLVVMIVCIINKFKVDVFVEKDDEQVNGKSIMGFMMFVVGKGLKVKFFVIGDDVIQMFNEFDQFFVCKFDEV